MAAAQPQQPADPVRALVAGAKTRFLQFGQQHGWGEAQFAREAEFAVQALRANDYTMKIATQSDTGRMSLRDGIVQAAVLGISLNPALGHAYLVPYGDRVQFHPSYRGLRDLAIEDGLIRWARAEVVHQNDHVAVRECEDGQRIISHEFNPFATDRGEIVGAYCAWEDGNGRRDLVFETEAEILTSHRARSIAFTKQGSGIWKTDPIEARRKALIKRAQKSWPRRTDRRASRFDDALTATIAAEDSIETTATEVRRAPESSRIARPSAVQHQGKASTLVAEEAPTASVVSVDALWREIDAMTEQLADGDLGKATAVAASTRAALGFAEDADLEPEQVVRLHEALKAQVEG